MNLQQRKRERTSLTQSACGQIYEITDDDIKDLVGVAKPGHRKKLLKQIAVMKVRHPPNIHRERETGQHWQYNSVTRTQRPGASPPAN